MDFKKDALRFINLLASGCRDDSPWEQIDLDYARDCFRGLNNCISLKEKFDYINLIEELVKDRLAKNYFGVIAEDWVTYLNISFKNYSFDSRNEESVKLGNILFNETDIYGDSKEECIKDLLSTRDLYDTDICEYIFLKMVHNDKVSQQLFSSMVFYFLEKYGRESVIEDINQLKEVYNFNNNWYILPIV